MANNFEGNVEGQQPQSAEAANSYLYSAVQDLMSSDMFKNISEKISNAAEHLPGLDLFGSNGQDGKPPDKAAQPDNGQGKLEQSGPERTASNEGLREPPSKAEPAKDGGQPPAPGQDLPQRPGGELGKSPSNGGDMSDKSESPMKSGHPPAWQPGAEPVNPKSLEQNAQPNMDAMSAFPTVEFVDSAASSTTAQLG